jgi:translation initiation factor IF-1
MSKKDCMQFSAIVTEVLKGGQFKVRLENGHECICVTSGRIKQNFIRIIKGDEVTIELSPYDLNLGRIVYRGKKEN